MTARAGVRGSAGCRLCGRQSCCPAHHCCTGPDPREQFGLVSLASYSLSTPRPSPMSALLRLSSIFSRGLDFPCGSAVHVADRSAAGCRRSADGATHRRLLWSPGCRPIVRIVAALHSLRWAPFRRRCFDERFSFAGWIAATRDLVATGVVSIGLAAAHSGAWALAWGTLAGTFSTRSPYGYLYWSASLFCPAERHRDG